MSLLEETMSQIVVLTYVAAHLVVQLSIPPCDKQLQSNFHAKY